MKMFYKIADAKRLELRDNFEEAKQTAAEWYDDFENRQPEEWMLPISGEDEAYAESFETAGDAERTSLQTRPLPAKPDNLDQCKTLSSLREWIFEWEKRLTEDFFEEIGLPWEEIQNHLSLSIEEYTEEEIAQRLSR